MSEKLNENYGKIKRFLCIFDRKNNSVIIPYEEVESLEKKIRNYGSPVYDRDRNCWFYFIETEKIPPYLKAHDISEEHPEIKKIAQGFYLSVREFTQFF